MDEWQVLSVKMAMMLWIYKDKMNLHEDGKMNYNVTVRSQHSIKNKFNIIQLILSQKKKVEQTPSLQVSLIPFCSVTQDRHYFLSIEICFVVSKYS